MEKMCCEHLLVGKKWYDSVILLMCAERDWVTLHHPKGAYWLRKLSHQIKVLTLKNPNTIQVIRLTLVFSCVKAKHNVDGPCKCRVVERQ
jgi:hypothetical protein